MILKGKQNYLLHHGSVLSLFTQQRKSKMYFYFEDKDRCLFKFETFHEDNNLTCLWQASWARREKSR
jgi:hypothetical protein